MVPSEVGRTDRLISPLDLGKEYSLPFRPDHGPADNPMKPIREVATLTSKGQITLPKPIRQALGVDAGGKLAFNFTGDRVVVTRVADEPHVDPAITHFLAMLENDIASGKNVRNLPRDLAKAMASTIKASRQNKDDDISGDVEL